MNLPAGGRLTEESLPEVRQAVLCLPFAGLHSMVTGNIQNWLKDSFIIFEAMRGLFHL